MHFIMEGEVTENQVGAKLTISVIDIPDTCGQIFDLSMIRGVQSKEKV